MSEDFSPVPASQHRPGASRVVPPFLRRVAGALRKTAADLQLGEVWKRLKRNRAAMAGLYLLAFIVVVAVFAPVFAPYSPVQGDLRAVLQRPSWSHLMGTDELGRDILSRVIFGARLSLAVGFVAVSIALLLGTILGAVAGYYGGPLDDVIMRVMDVLLAFPSILLALALMVMLGHGLNKAMIAIGIVEIPSYARIVRGSVLAVREQEYVESARALGVPTGRIIRRHILPNVLAPIIVRATLGISEAILEAAALGFLGLGAQLPQPEWGAMLSRSRNYIISAPWAVFFPGFAITVTVLALNLLGDGLRDALDPRLKAG